MLSLIRKHQYALFVIVLIVAIAFFVFPDSRQTNARNFGEHDGRPMNVLGTKFSPEEIEAIRRSGDILMALGGGTEGFDPRMHFYRMEALATRTQAMTEEEAAKRRDFVVNTALTRVLARQAGVSVSEAEVSEHLQKLTQFQTDGKFDPVKWGTFIEAFGGEAGARRKAIYQAAADVILFDKLTALAGPFLPRTKADVDLTYAEEYQRVTASVIELASKEFENQEVTEQELKDYFEKHKGSENLQSDEKRTFSYVFIPAPKPEELKDLDDTAKKEKEREHKKVAQALSNQLVAEDRGAKTFDEIAAGLKLEVKKVGPISQDALPDDLKAKGQVTSSLFALVEPGQSSVEPGTDGFYGIELTAIEPAKPLEFDAAKEKITTLLKEQKQKEKFDAFVKSTREKLQTAVAGGKSLADAAKEAGLTAAPRALPTFSRRQPLTADPNGPRIAATVSKTDVGQIGEPITLADSALLVLVEKKELPKDPKMEDDKKSIALRQSMMASRFPEQNPVFSAWYNKKREQADAGLTAQ